VADYANYYGTDAIEAIIAAERRHAKQHPGVEHKLTLDMTRLGLSEVMLELEGIDIANLENVPARRHPYYDSSQNPPKMGHFDHTQDGSVNPAHDHQYVPVERRDDLRGLGNNTISAPGREMRLEPLSDFSGFLDKMLAAAQSGDDAAFRRMTQALADLPPGRQMREEAKAAVDRQEQLAARQEMEQQAVVRQEKALVVQMAR
jgi:hypothetical protein